MTADGNHPVPGQNRVCIAVIVPALNEAGNIGGLAHAVLALKPVYPNIAVIVVNNGSTDGTAEEAAGAGAQVVNEPRRGYGAACAAGAAAAASWTCPAEVLVFIDGDGSSLPREMPRLLEPILNDAADLVQGSRPLGGILPGAMPLQQRWGNRLAVWLIQLLYGISLTDLGPYRALRLKTLMALAMREMTFGWPTEMTVKAARQGLRITEPPVTYAPRGAGKSKVSGSLRGALLAGYFILGVTLRYALSNRQKGAAMQKFIRSIFVPQVPLAWIALLRMMLGVVFLTTWASNLLKGYYTPDGLLRFFTEVFPQSENPLGWYAAFINNIILPSRTFFAPFQVVGEFLIGLFLLIGALTPLACLAAGFFIINTFLATFGHDWPWSYGMILGLLFVIFWTRAGRSLGVDGFWQAYRERKAASSPNAAG